MTPWRTARAVLTSAVVWGAAWACVGALVAAVRSLSLDGPTRLTRTLTWMIETAGIAGVWGAVTGTAFAIALLSLRRRQRSTVSSTRFLKWGAVAGVAVPGLAIGVTALQTGVFLVQPWWLLFPVVGAVTGASLARIARGARLAEGRAELALGENVWSINTASVLSTNEHVQHDAKRE